MIIETKFNAGDRVWAMYCDKPKEFVIYEVIIGRITINFKTHTTYTFEGYNGHSPTIAEHLIFDSKEQLINSL
jgi:hypothetical protein